MNEKEFEEYEKKFQAFITDHFNRFRDFQTQLMKEVEEAHADFCNSEDPKHDRDSCLKHFVMMYMAELDRKMDQDRTIRMVDKFLRERLN